MVTLVFKVSNISDVQWFKKYNLYLSLWFDALSLSFSCLSNSSASPQLQTNPAVGVAHGHHRQEVGDDHEGHVVPDTGAVDAQNLFMINPINLPGTACIVQMPSK